jgi:hypothetical protein
MRWSLALALGLVLPRAGEAFEWQGRVGSEYRRDEAWSPDGGRSRYPRLGVDLGLDVGGYFVQPGAIDYSGGVNWNWFGDSASGGDVQRQLTYRLLTAIFSDPRSPLSLVTQAERSTAGYTGAGSGQLTTTTVGTQASVQVPDRPQLNLGYQYLHSDQESQQIGDSRRSVHSVSGAVSSGTSVFNYDTSYRGNFGKGTYASDNADDHSVQVSASMNPAPGYRLHLSDGFFLRLPTFSSGYNPHQEMNAFSAQLVQGEAGAVDLQSGGYHYAHGVQTTPLETAEQTQHRFDYQNQRALTPQWRLRSFAGVSLLESRLGGLTQKTSAQNLGAVATWRRGTGGDFLEVRGGPTASLLEPEGKGSTFGYGGTAGAGASRSWGVLVGQASYDFRYEKDVSVEGWAITQGASAGANGPLGRGQLTGQLLLSSDRRTSPLFGSSANRSVTGLVGYRIAQAEAQLQATLVDGGTGVSGDGLFIPAGYDSHTRRAVLSLATPVVHYVRFRGKLSYSSTDLPDRPALTESEAQGALELAYGAFRFTVDDRYVISEVPLGGTNRVNQLFVRVDRAFGSRY